MKTSVSLNARRLSSASAAWSWRERAVSATSSQPSIWNEGATGAARKRVVDPVGGVEAAEEVAGAVEVERRRDDERPLDPALEQQRQRPGGVLGRDRRGRLDHELDLGPAPCVAHLPGLGRRAVRRPAAEDDRAGRVALGEPLGLGHDAAAASGDPVGAVGLEGSVPGYDDRGGRDCASLQSTGRVSPGWRRRAQSASRRRGGSPSARSCSTARRTACSTRFGGSASCSSIRSRRSRRRSTSSSSAGSARTTPPSSTGCSGSTARSSSGTPSSGRSSRCRSCAR